MIRVPVFLAIETDDPAVAADVARAVADGSPQAQGPADGGDCARSSPTYYSINLASQLKTPTDEPTLLFDKGTGARTYVPVLGVHRDVL